MPVVKTTLRAMSLQNRPDWSQVTALGQFSVPTVGGRFDRHYHDCDEYWLIYAGRARIMTEGVEYDVEPGDVVCTQAGQEHDVVAVHEDLQAFFFEDVLVGDKRLGHLHKRQELAEGHPVPAILGNRAKDGGVGE